MLEKTNCRVASRTESFFNEIFNDYKFVGSLERLVLEFTMREWEEEQGVSLANSSAPPAPSFMYVPVIYQAYGLKAEIIYHGDPFYVRKYSPQPPSRS